MEPSISVVLVIGRKFEPKGENRALQTRLEPRRTPTPREGRRRLKACLGLASEATALVSSPKPVSQAVDPGGCWGKVAVLERGAFAEFPGHADLEAGKVTTYAAAAGLTVLNPGQASHQW
jgi:hypothetical protein